MKLRIVLETNANGDNEYVIEKSTTKLVECTPIEIWVNITSRPTYEQAYNTVQYLLSKRIVERTIMGTFEE